MNEKKSRWVKPQLIHLDPYGGAGGAHKETQGGIVKFRAGGATTAGFTMVNDTLSQYFADHWEYGAMTVADTGPQIDWFESAAPAS